MHNETVNNKGSTIYVTTLLNDLTKINNNNNKKKQIENIHAKQYATNEIRMRFHRFDDATSTRFVFLSHVCNRFFCLLLLLLLFLKQIHLKEK